MRRFTGNMPMIDPVNDMKITDDYFKALQKKINMFEERMRKHSLTGTPGLEAKYQQFVKKVEVSDQSSSACTS
jgi:ATP-dependent RNA helicase DOB1